MQKSNHFGGWFDPLMVKRLDILVVMCTQNIHRTSETHKTFTTTSNYHNKHTGTHHRSTTQVNNRMQCNSRMLIYNARRPRNLYRYHLLVVGDHRNSRTTTSYTRPVPQMASSFLPFSPVVCRLV